MSIKPNLIFTGKLPDCLRHQISALAVMIEREHGTVVQPNIPSLWRSSQKSNKARQVFSVIKISAILLIIGHVYSYRHIITGEEARRPCPLRGGILADVSLATAIPLQDFRF